MQYIVLCKQYSFNLSAKNKNSKYNLSMALINFSHGSEDREISVNFLDEFTETVSHLIFHNGSGIFMYVITPTPAYGA